MAKTKEEINENNEINDLSLEQAFDKIEELLSEMGSEDVPLEKSFDLYKKGMELLNHCNNKIDKVEKQVKELSE